MKLRIIFCLLFISAFSTLSAQADGIDNQFKLEGGKVIVSGVKFVWINEAGDFDVVLDPAQTAVNQTLEISDSAHNPVDFQFVGTTADSILLKPNQDLKNFKNYLISAGANSFYAYYSLDYLAKQYNYTGPLGVELNDSEKKAVFRLWSPSAEAVTLLLLDPKTESVLFQEQLVPGNQGVWSVTIHAQKDSPMPSLNGLHYRYVVQGFGQTQTVLDPYARAMAGFNPKAPDYLGTGAVISFPKADPFTPLPGVHAGTSDFFGMEIHVHDASVDPSSGVDPNLRGTYLGVLPLIKGYHSMGVNYLQFMPLQKFNSIDETNRSYQGNLPAGNHPNYSWGYDPQNFFTPEGWFSVDPSDPELRIHEVQKMVDGLHQAGIGAILDVVYNHIGNGQGFEAAAPGTYLRRDRNGNVSMATGAGSTFETRAPMARRLILDSLQYWQDVFHIDGFRFDWMGFIDHETMRQIRLKLNPATILYGEAWPTTDLPAADATIKTNLPVGLQIGAFNDTSRDSFSGRDNQGNGFIQGQTYNLPVVRAGIIASITNHPQQSLLINQKPYVDNSGYNSFAENPSEVINYLAIHDGFTVWDKVNLSINASKAMKQAMVKSGLAMTFLAQGRVMMLSGDEIGRTKPLADNDPDAKDAVTASYVIPGGSSGTSLFFQGNSYASPDYTNAIRWDQASANADLTAYVSGLAALRHATPALRYEDSDPIRKNLSFLITDPSLAIVAYSIHDAQEWVVVHNGEKTSQTVSIPDLADPTLWSTYVDCDHAGTSPLVNSSVSLQKGQITIPANCSAVIAK